MQNLYIHIGAHKTGTTSLQSSFESGAKTLATNGVFYPHTNWYHHSQHRLAFAMKKMRDPVSGEIPDLDSEVAELTRAISKNPCNKVFISSEELFSCGPRRIAALKAALDAGPVPMRVHIIATVRRPDTLLLSMYNQKSKQPGNTFARPIRAFVNAPATIDKDLSFHTCIGSWMDVFGEKNTTVLRYEDGSCIHQILTVLDLPTDTLPSPERMNESVPGVVTEIMRVAKFNKMDEKRQTKLYRLALKVMEGRPTFYLSDDDRKSIVKACQADNDALFQRLGQTNPYTLETYIPVETGDLRNNMTHADSMQIIDALLGRPFG